ncbi:MAG: saccharopine dehydrogenase NADP-binding domain-containing protein [Hahellaceae bacterium]|nr:saccharopine dehydrogenase NADP-binding domain-containing protein [Hahellaceae bacterium]
MLKVVVMGAGKIGSVIADMLAATKEYKVTLADQDEGALQRAQELNPAIRIQQVDAENSKALTKLIRGQYALLNACPFTMNAKLVPLAVEEGVHYLDLTEDVASTRHVKALAKKAKSALIPQCGLAPGFVSVAAASLAQHFDTLLNVQMRVGALPMYPNNALKYNLTWSTDGLINEYLNPCEAIVNGERREVPPMEELEHFTLDGDNYEAFNTSGGLGTLCETLAGKVQNLNYRTVRYPGHRDLMKMLLNDLRLGENRPLLKQIFENSIPVTMQDVVLVYVTVSGYKKSMLVQESFVRKVYGNQFAAHPRSAIQITTASGICTALDLLAEGKLPAKGFIRQEDISLKDFLANRFGCCYNPPQSPSSRPSNRKKTA